MRPFGHTGSDVMASEAETEEAKAFRLEVHRLENEKKPQKAPKTPRVVEEPVLEAVSEPEPELEVIAVIEEAEKPSRNILSGDIDIGPLEDKIDEKEAEIARLKAQLAELEK